MYRMTENGLTGMCEVLTAKFLVLVLTSWSRVDGRSTTGFHKMVSYLHEVTF